MPVLRVLRPALLLLFGPLLLALLFAAAAPPAHAQEEQRPAGPDWQQEVAYEMDITLKADRHQMHGTQRLRYTNHSPDTLRRVFYHLYFNAFQPTSMMAERNRALPDPDSRIVPRIFNLGPKEIGYHRVLSLSRGGRALAYDIDDTVMEVPLEEPILPGETTTFEMRFRSQVPLQTRRSGRDNEEGIDYSMTQWYPKMAAYDEQGWHADPYVGREFYAPFGSFDVEITLPARYTLGATGQLRNPEDVGHGYGDGGGADGLWRPSDLRHAPGDSLTWHYQAQNVHDFAWAADPDYLHRRIVGDPPPGANPADPSAGGVTYHLLYQPGVAEGWEPMAEWVPGITTFFSEEYGAYPYPQFTVAQGGDGGMEYPMITLITGRRAPASLFGVTAHEMAHMWFYGVLASNEADYAWMDEGFTSYATTEAAAAVFRGEENANPSHAGAYLSVLYAQDLGLFERLNTPADWFETNLGYGTAAYSGGEMVVDMLGYVIGDAALQDFFDEYYRRFKYRHPQPDDLENIAEDVSGLELDWYFEQFTQTEREHDYALGRLNAVRAENGSDGSSGDGSNAWMAEVTLERNAPVVMPADVRITLEDGSEQWATVPLTIMEGHKPVPESWAVADAWPWTFEEHTIRVPVPARPVAAEVNPTGRAPDQNRLNNTTRLPVEARFLEAPGQSWASYRVGWRPLLQYAHSFGPGGGAVARGQYIFDKHQAKAMLKLWPQPLLSGGEEPGLLPDDEGFDEDRADVSAFDAIDYELSYQTEVEALGPEAEAGARFEKHLGFLENRLSFERPLAKYGSDAEQTLSLSLVHQLNPTDRTYSADYSTTILSGPFANVDATLRARNPFQRTHMVSGVAAYDVYDGMDRFSATLEAGASLRGGLAGRDPSALRLRLDTQKGYRFGKLLAGRASFSFGLGARSLAFHKQFRLGAASFEERWRHDAFRTASAAFARPAKEAYLVAFRGAGPVAYAGQGFGSGPDAIQSAPVGRGLVGGTLALEAGPFSPNEYVRPLRLEAFSGIGQVWNGGAFLAGFNLDALIADVGLGLRYDLAQAPFFQRYAAQSDVVSGLELVAKFPFWASDPERAGRDDNEGEFAFRPRVGLTLTP